jgi:hypothetical protein
VDLRDVEHLHMVMTALEAETDVAEIARHRDPRRATGRKESFKRFLTAGLPALHAGRFRAGHPGRAGALLSVSCR